MLNKVRKYFASYFTEEDFRIQVKCPANYVWMSRGTIYAWDPWICALAERHHSRAPRSKVSTKGSPKPVLQSVLSLDVNIQTLFLHYLFVKYKEIISADLSCPCYAHGCRAKQTKSIQFCTPAPALFIGAQVDFGAIANICWLNQTPE